MTILAKTKASCPQADKDYPRSYGEFLAWFPDDAACLDYLDWLRWPNGFTCPRCGGETSWRLSDGRWWCAGCRRRISVTAGTIYHRTQTPLALWFAAAWYITSSKNGVSAKTLHRLLSFGSYQTIWAMLHRYRNAMVRPGRDRLCGDLKVIPNAQSPTRRSFLLDHVEPGSTLITDGLSSYHVAAGSDYVHNPTPVKGSGMKVHEWLPGVHRVASLVKRWRLGTHQGAVEEDHLRAYLHEFTFRFNRRRSRARGMLFYRLLQQAVETAPASFKELVVNPKPRVENKPIPPKVRRIAPPSLQVVVPPHPWR